MFIAQRKKIAQFNSYVKEHEIPRMGIQARDKGLGIRDKVPSDVGPSVDMASEVVPEVVPEVCEPPSDGVRINYEEEAIMDF